MTHLFLKSATFLTFVLITSFARAELPLVVNSEGSAQDFNVGGCSHGSPFQEPRIQSLAVREALMKVINENPVCTVPVLRAFTVLEEEYFAKCSWTEEYRVKITAEFDCR